MVEYSSTAQLLIKAEARIEKLEQENKALQLEIVNLRQRNTELQFHYDEILKEDDALRELLERPRSYMPVLQAPPSFWQRIKPSFNFTNLFSKFMVQESNGQRQGSDTRGTTATSELKPPPRYQGECKVSFSSRDILKERFMRFEENAVVFYLMNDYRFKHPKEMFVYDEKTLFAAGADRISVGFQFLVKKQKKQVIVISESYFHREMLIDAVAKFQAELFPVANNP